MVNYKFKCSLIYFSEVVASLFLGCPPNHFRNIENCYWFGDQTKTWYNARQECKKEGVGYDLVVIDDTEENKFLREKIETLKNGQYWIGLKANNRNDWFVWVDGSALTFEDWDKSSKEPDRVMQDFFDRYFQ